MRVLYLHSESMCVVGLGCLKLISRFMLLKQCQGQMQYAIEVQLQNTIFPAHVLHFLSSTMAFRTCVFSFSQHALKSSQ